MIAYLLSGVAVVWLWSQPAPSNGEAFVAFRTSAMQAGATSAEVGRATDLLADDAIYEHPAFGARVAGRQAIAKAMEARIGTTRNARSLLLERVSLNGVSVLTEQLSFEARDGEAWRPVTRRQLLLFEYKDGKVSRILEYWER